MKTAGVILFVLGCLSTLGGIMAAIGGHRPNFTGVAIVVLGAFLISRANKKKAEAEQKKKWEDENKYDK
ncbi:hypothetical protein VR611_12635 [Aquirufa nivalisilvae]